MRIRPHIDLTSGLLAPINSNQVARGSDYLHDGYSIGAALDQLHVTREEWLSHHAGHLASIERIELPDDTRFGSPLVLDRLVCQACDGPDAIYTFAVS
jgi:hypothetical protein